MEAKFYALTVPICKRCLHWFDLIGFEPFYVVLITVIAVPFLLIYAGYIHVHDR